MQSRTLCIYEIYHTLHKSYYVSRIAKTVDFCCDFRCNFPLFAPKNAAKIAGVNGPLKFSTSVLCYKSVQPSHLPSFSLHFPFLQTISSTPFNRYPGSQVSPRIVPSSRLIQSPVRWPLRGCPGNSHLVLDFAVKKIYD